MTNPCDANNIMSSGKCSICAGQFYVLFASNFKARDLLVGPANVESKCMQTRLILWLILVLFSTAAVWRISSLTDFQLVGKLVDRVATSQKVVALTFDDGPEPNKTEQILQILAGEQIPATFF